MHLINKFSRNLLVITFTILLSFNSMATTKEAAGFINDLAERVISLLKKTDITEEEKETQLTEMFLKYVDTRWIGKFAIGKYWRTLNSEQQSNYLGLYSKYLTNLYVPNFRKYTGNVVKVISATETRKNEYLVQTELNDSSKGLSIKIDYRLIQKQEGLENFIIFDVVAEGVSLITTQRAEMNSVMENGNYNKLIDLLTRKTNSVK